MRPIISVIIPVYNSESTIKKTLESVLHQSFSDFELIIIDDGSKDNSKKIICSFKNDKRIKYFYQKNSGVSAARNKGLSLAKGEYISFLDSDDLYEKDFLEKMHSKISKENAEICYCGYSIIEKDRKMKRYNKFYTNNLLRDYYLDKIPLCTSSWLIKSEIIRRYNLKFSEGISWGEDVEFFSKIISYSKRSTFVPEYLTNYVVRHSENQLSNFSLEQIDNDYDSIMRLLNNTQINHSPEIEKVLLNYRLPALLTYKIWSGFEQKINPQELMRYYNKYKSHLMKFTWNNGLRSLKLNITRLRLRRLINT